MTQKIYTCPNTSPMSASKRLSRISWHRFYFSLLVVTLLAGCLPSPQITNQQATKTPFNFDQPLPSESPTRPVYQPGELVDYTVQDGDTVSALAARFNTTVGKILENNSGIPNTTTTLPPGMPMQIPIFYLPLWGSQNHILPNALYVNGPAEVGFDAVAFANSQPGWLKDYKVYAYDGWRTGSELVAYIGMSYSVSPRLLLALLEYRFHALTDPQMPANVDKKLLGHNKEYYENFYLQLLWLADTLNDGYYSWLRGDLLSQDLEGGELERFDPWQNAATVTIQHYLARVLTTEDYHQAISPAGLALTYVSLFGDIRENQQAIMPGSLEQPAMKLPFVQGKSWSYTGGPHPVWGELNPWAAIDFAPPAEKGGCTVSYEWVAAVADGVLSRTEVGLAILDLDGDGDERTGWSILYLHLSHLDAAPQGKQLKAGDVIGHPSCERGRATGTHIHIARKYNGQWIPADGTIPFNLEGWISSSNGIAYKGELKRNTKILEASTVGDAYSQIVSEQ
jgi:LasA protease